MRVVLIYPPPWKVPASGQAPASDGDGPPPGFRPTDLDADFFQMPYGLLSLAAQALRAGHELKILNLSSYPWTKVERIVAELDADLFGLTCYTANRRGVALVARTIRRHHPSSHVVVGGPHSSALPLEMLSHHPEIDTVVVGEGEGTFLELCTRLSTGAAVTGLAGTAYRKNGQPLLGPARARLTDLDELASPHDYFDTHLVMTARGCPGRCTFCAKNAVWGHLYRTQSVEYVVAALQAALDRVPVRMLLVKDDTFTADRKRGLAICRRIRERGLDFLWSCDTRADAIDEELLREMRLAGCQRLSIGVESGSAEVLRNIAKKVTPQAIFDATQAAKRFGLQVRYYLMLGNRGETAATFHESLAFVEAAKPHQALFACLSVYPGTQDFRDLEEAGALDREEYFAGDFQELKTPYDASAEDTRVMGEWFEQNAGLRDLYRASADECRAILERLGDHHAAHLDLAAACLHEGALDDAERHGQRALDLGLPAPGLAHNLLACVAAKRGRWQEARRHLAASSGDSQHRVVVQNSRALQSWLERGGAAAGPAPSLDPAVEFELLERTAQPMLPGPLPDEVLRWSPRT